MKCPNCNKELKKEKGIHKIVIQIESEEDSTTKDEMKE